jgi:hypothetical protein
MLVLTRRMHLNVCVAFFGWTVLTWLLSGCDTPSTSNRPDVPEVNWRDIPGRVRIIGRLGRPLGEVVDVEGRWVMMDKGKQFSKHPGFEVIKVNGQHVDLQTRFEAWEFRPIDGYAKRLEPVEGEVLVLRGVETGRLVGYSNQVWDELEVEAGTGLRPQDFAGGFGTEFHYIRAKKLE